MEEEKSEFVISIRKDLLFIVCALIIGIFIGYIFSNVSKPQQTFYETFYETQSNEVKRNEIKSYDIDVLKENVTKYIDENFLAQLGVKSKIINYTEYENIIRFSVEVNFSGQVDVTDVYVTKDGKYLLLGSLFDLSKPLPKLQVEQPQNQNKKDYGKAEKPRVMLFVMSFCPYGQQAEKGMFPVVELLKDKINFSLHFVIYGPEYYNNDSRYCMEGLCAMHGINELKENIRQMCVIKYYPTKYVEYINEINDNCNYENVETCWKEIAEKVGIDINKIEECAKGEGIEMAREDKRLNEIYGVLGSPTIFINDVEYYGGRSPEDFKLAICSSFISEPPECSQVLSTTSAAPSGSC